MSAEALLEEGTVLAVDPPMATVRVERGDACASCGSGCMCAADPSNHKIMMVQAVNRAEAGVGDRVKIALEPEKFLSLAALAYLLPLVFLFAGAFLGPTITAATGLSLTGDPARAVFSLVGLVVGIIVLKLIFLRVKPTGTFTPVLVEVMKNSGVKAPYLDLPK